MSSLTKWSFSLGLSASFLCLPYLSIAQSIPDWSVMTAPSESGLGKPSIVAVGFSQKTPEQIVKASPSLNAPETTNSIVKASSVFVPFTHLTEGWNVSSDPANANLIFARDGKALPVGFSCKKGDGFVTFRSPPTTSFAANKRILVTLKSLHGSIRIESKTSEGLERIIESEVPVRTSSLVFVLTPKKGDVTAHIGGMLETITALKSDVKILRFQSLCDQPLISAADE
jgi:hypothetical protein